MTGRPDYAEEKDGQLGPFVATEGILIKVRDQFLLSLINIIPLNAQWL